MDVVQGKNVEDVVLFAPAPGMDEGFYLRLEIAMGGHDPLGFAGGAAGIEDRCRAFRSDLGQRRQGSSSRLRWIEQATPSRGCKRAKALGEVSRDEGGIRFGVREDVLQLRRGVGEAEWNGNAAGLPDSPEARHIMEAGGDEKDDARAAQIRPSLQ